MFLDDTEGTVFVDLGGFGGAVVHGDIPVVVVVVVVVVLLLLRRLRGSLLAGIQPGGFLGVRCDDCDFIGVVTG